MSRITWDDIGKRIFEMGSKYGVLYPQVDGKYPKGVAWNGLISVTESPGGAEVTDLWADNIKYASMRSAETFGATIEAYSYPDEFGPCDGSVELVPGVFIGQQGRQAFGFCYRSEIGNDTSNESDDGYKLHLIYNSTASPSEKAYSTINDSPDGVTFSWEIESTPVNVPGHKPTACITIDSLKIDSAKLKALEDILYGTESKEPSLPMPEEIMTLLSGEATE